MKYLEHYIQEFGFICVQREAWGQEGSYLPGQIGTVNYHYSL